MKAKLVALLVPPLLKVSDMCVGDFAQVTDAKNSSLNNHILYRPTADRIVDLTTVGYCWMHEEIIDHWNYTITKLPAGTKLVLES